MLGAVGLGLVALVLALVIVIDPELGTTPESAAGRAAQSLEEDAVAHGPWTDAEAAAVDYHEIRVPLRSAGLTTPAVVDVAELREIDDATAVATLDWGWRTDPESATGVPDWTYTTELRVVKDRLSWRAEFAPEVVHPDLLGGAGFVVDAVPADRGSITGVGDTVLASTETVIEVGVEPGRVDDLDELLDVLDDELDIDAEALGPRIESAADTAFVEVITLRREDYNAAAGAIRPVPGTVFRESTMSVPLEQGFAPLLVGRVGPATAEDIEEAPGRVHAGEHVGRGGLQERFESELAGQDGYRIMVAAPDGSGGDGAGGSGDAGESGTGGDGASGDAGDPEAPRDPVFESDPREGRPVRTTIDPDIQLAVDALMDGREQPTAMVALDVDSCEVRAVGNHVGGENVFDRALLGEYASGPGSRLVDDLVRIRQGAAAGSGAVGSGAAGTGAAGSAEDREKAAADLGMTGISVGLDAVDARVEDGGVMASPLAAAVGAAAVERGETCSPVLITESGGSPFGPAVPERDGITPDEADGLSAAGSHPAAESDSGSEGEAGSAGDGAGPSWVTGAASGMVYVLVAEATDPAEVPARDEIDELLEEAAR